MEDLTNNIQVTFFIDSDKLKLHLDKTEIRLDTLGQTYEFTFVMPDIMPNDITHSAGIIYSYDTKYTLICQNKETGRISRTPVENNYVRLDASILSVGDNDLYLYAYNEEVNGSILSEPATLSLIYTLATDTTLPAKYNAELEQHIKDIYYDATQPVKPTSDSASIPTFYYPSPTRTGEWIDDILSYWNITTDIQNVPTNERKKDSKYAYTFNVVFRNTVATENVRITFNEQGMGSLSANNVARRVANNKDVFAPLIPYTLTWYMGELYLSDVNSVDPTAQLHMLVDHSRESYPNGLQNLTDRGYQYLNTHISDMYLTMAKDSNGKIYFTYTFNEYNNAARRYTSLLTSTLVDERKVLPLLDGTYRFFFSGVNANVSDELLQVLADPTTYARNGQIEIETTLHYNDWEKGNYVDKECITIITVDPDINNLSYVSDQLQINPQYGLLCNVMCQTTDLKDGKYYAYPIIDANRIFQLNSNVYERFEPLQCMAISSKIIDGNGYEHYTIDAHNITYFNHPTTVRGDNYYCDTYCLIRFNSKPSIAANGIMLSVKKTDSAEDGYINFPVDMSAFEQYTPYQQINEYTQIYCRMRYVTRVSQQSADISTYIGVAPTHSALFYTMGLADPTVQRETDNLGLYTASTDAKNIIKALEAYALAAHDGYRKDKYFSDLPTDFMVATTTTQTVDTSTAVLNADTVTDDTQRYYVTIENLKVAVNGTSKLVEGLSYATFSIWYERSNTMTQYYIYMWHDDVTSTTYNYQISVGQSIIHNKE